MGLRTPEHEASHAALVHSLGWPCGPVSARGGEHAHGVTRWTYPLPRTEEDRLAWMAGTAQILLAGDIGAELLPPSPRAEARGVAYRPAAGPRAAWAPAAASERAAVAADCSQPHENDADGARRIALEVTSGDEYLADAWLDEMAAEARERIAAYAPAAMALAERARQVDVVSAAEVAAILGERASTMKCTFCGRSLPVDSSAAFCPSCGTPVRGGLAGVVSGGPSLPCPGCGEENDADAQYCQSCGRLLPHSWSDASGAVADATSSSGRGPIGLPERERVAHLARKAAMREMATSRFALPEPSGDSMINQAREWDRLQEIETEHQRWASRHVQLCEEYGEDHPEALRAKIYADQLWQVREDARRRHERARSADGRDDFRDLRHTYGPPSER